MIMILYDFECSECGNVFEHLAHVDDRLTTCPDCNGESKRLISAPNINMGVGAYGYYDDTLQTYINSNRHRKQVCREQGVYPKDETPKNFEAWV